VIVRIVLWRLDERSPPLETLRDALEGHEPLDAPSMLLVNETAERIGALVVSEEDEGAPRQLDELRALVGREPDLYEEFDALT
jgi:hypothetical protein